MPTIYEIRVNNLVIEPPTTRREAGDELSRRAVARVKADPRTSMHDALNAERKRDSYLDRRYLEG